MALATQPEVRPELEREWRMGPAQRVPYGLLYFLRNRLMSCWWTVQPTYLHRRDGCKHLCRYALQSFRRYTLGPLRQLSA